MSDETVVDESASEEPVSREDELGAIFDEANAEETGQARDEQGRFAKTEETENETPSDTATEKVAEGATEESTESTDQSAEQEDKPETVLAAPASWSDTETATWSGLGLAVQETILRREADWLKADGERATRLKGYEPIDAALASVRQQLQLNGQNEGQFVAQLVAADQYLRTNPQEAMQWIANQYGIDLSQIQPAESDIDPVLVPLHQKITALEGQLTNFVNTQHQQDASRVNGELDTFAKDHPHFEAVRQHMGALIQSGTAADMNAAYDMAVWADPTTRAALQAEQSTETEAKRKAEAEEKASKARRVSETNLSTNGAAGGATPTQYKTREDELGAIYDTVAGA